jgi:ketosteroid isomerase-like protein
MRIATVLAIGVYALAGAPSIATAQATACDTVAVQDVLRRFHEALARGDSAGALALLAEDAVILEAGSIESRVEYRAHHLPADIRFAAAVPTKSGPLHVVLAGDVAWVSSTSEVVGSFEGRAVNSVGAELAVLMRAADGWRIRAIHWSSRRRTGP